LAKEFQIYLLAIDLLGVHYGCDCVRGLLCGVYKEGISGRSAIHCSALHAHHLRLEMQFLHLWKTTVMGVMGKGNPKYL